MPASAAAAAAARAGAWAAAPVVVVESHITGFGEVKTTSPAGLVAVSRPVVVFLVTLRPTVSSLNLSVARSGCLAAAAVLTTSSWEKPSTSAFSWRSTSGSTLAYVATFAASVGSGSACGQVNDRVRPFFTPVSSGPVPPPEKAIATAEAFGFTFPSAANCSVGSVATQPPARRTRTVVPCRLTDHFPVGSAHVSEFSVRADVNS